jgi:hypothetical protein
MHDFDLATTVFEQSPTRGEFFATHQSTRNQIEALAADSLLRFYAERLGTVGEKICTRDLALDQHRVAGSLPANGVGHLSADAGLLGEHDSAAIAAQPVDGFFD